MSDVEPMVKKIVYTEKEFAEIREHIFSAKDQVEVFKATWKYLVGIDIDDESLSKGEVKAWEYKVSDTLMNEIMEYSMKLSEKKDRVSTGLMWLNYGPSSSVDLKPNEIRREIP